MARSLNTDSQKLGTTSARLVATRLKSANKHIFRALLSLASANLLIRLMGMLNQIVVTAHFGQGAEMDAYFVASAMPVLFAQLLASALEASVIPVYARLRTRGSKKQASRLFSTLLNILVISVLLFTLIILFFPAQVILFSAPALQTSTQQIAIHLAPFIFPVLTFMVINSFMECLLNTEGQFGWPAYAGMLVPLTTATCVFMGGASFGVLMLCIGTLVGQALQLVAIIIRAYQAKIRYCFVLDLRSPELAAIGLVAWPAMFTALISQAAPLVDQMFASALNEGSIAAINNALKLISVPVGVVFSSAGRAALPYLASQAAIKDMKAFKETLRLYLWAIGIGTTLLTAMMILLAHPIVQILFQRGKFTAEDTQLTSITLVGFAIGLTPMAFGFITSRAFSALGKTRTLMYVTIFSVSANALFDYIFGGLWQSFGIALATSAVYFCTMVILLITLRRTIGKLSLLTPPNELLNAVKQPGIKPFFAQWGKRNGKRFPSLTIAYSIRKQMARGFVALAIFVAGAFGAIQNGIITLRIAFGSLAVLALLRFPYVLLLAWAALDALIGSTLPFFNGNNFLSGLVLPTLLLMFVMPVKMAFKRMPILAFLFAYLMWVFASIGISPIPVTQFLTYWTIYISYVAIAVLVINLLTTRKRVMGLIDAILLQCVFLALFGIYGYFTKSNGLYDTNIKGLYRIGSIFASPPTLAFLLSVTVPLALYRTVVLKGKWRIAGMLCTFILLAGLVLTFTRGAFISLLISIIVMIFFLPSRNLRITTLSGIGLIGLIGIMVVELSNLPVLNRFLNPDLATLNGRTLLWRALLDHFDPAKLLGNGMNASDDLLTRLQVGVGRGVIGTAPHNILISTLFDHGIIGVALVTLLLIAIPWTLIAKMRTAPPARRLILAMALAAYINIAIQSMEITEVWSQEVGVYIWMLLSLPFALYWDSANKQTGMTEAPIVQESAPVIEAVQLAEQEQLTHA